MIVPFVIVLTLVPPTGDFPLGDDWDYAHTANDLARLGELRLSDFPAMTLATHAAWGALFIKIFGFSFTVLRWANLTLLFAAGWLLLRWGRIVGLTLGQRWFLVSSVVCSPPLLWMAYSFHTNVTEIFFITLCLWLHATWIVPNRPFSLELMSLSASVGMLARQTAAMPIVGHAVQILVSRLPLKTRLADVGVAWAIPATIYALYQLWVRNINLPPANAQNRILHPELLLAPMTWLSHSFDLALRWGLWLGPITLSGFGRCWREPRRRYIFLAAVGVVVLVGVGLGHDFKPYSGWHVYDLGLGNDVSLSPGREDLVGPRIGSFSPFRIVTTGLAVMSLGLLIEVAVFQVRHMQGDGWRDAVQSPTGLATACCLGFVLLLLFVHPRHDWYLIPVQMLGAVALIAGQRDQLATPPGLLAWGVVIAYGLFGMTCVQDTLARNHAHWQAIHRLEAEGVASKEIDGGHEYNGLRRITPAFRGQPHRVRPFRRFGTEKDQALVEGSLWTDFSPTRRFTLSLHRNDDRKLKFTIPYRSWLRTGDIFVEERPQTVSDSKTAAPAN